VSHGDERLPTITPDETSTREPEQIHRDCSRKLRAVQVSPQFQAILGCLLGEDRTTPRLNEMEITPDGHIPVRYDGDVSFKAFLGASENLIKNITASPRSPNSMVTGSVFS
jgi:hypothetical protein